MARQSNREQYLLLLSTAAELLQCKCRLELTGLDFPSHALDELQQWVLTECEARQHPAYRELETQDKQADGPATHDIGW